MTWAHNTLPLFVIETSLPSKGRVTFFLAIHGFAVRYWNIYLFQWFIFRLWYCFIIIVAQHWRKHNFSLTIFCFKIKFTVMYNCTVNQRMSHTTLNEETLLTEYFMLQNNMYYKSDEDWGASALSFISLRLGRKYIRCQYPLLRNALPFNIWTALLTDLLSSLLNCSYIILLVYWR